VLLGNSEYRVGTFDGEFQLNLPASRPSRQGIYARSPSAMCRRTPPLHRLVSDRDEECPSTTMTIPLASPHADRRWPAHDFHAVKGLKSRARHFDSMTLAPATRTRRQHPSELVEVRVNLNPTPAKSSSICDGRLRRQETGASVAGPRSAPLRERLTISVTVRARSFHERWSFTCRCRSYQPGE
jgi:hypothetical protein